MIGNSCGKQVCAAHYGHSKIMMAFDKSVYKRVCESHILCVPCLCTDMCIAVLYLHVCAPHDGFVQGICMFACLCGCFSACVFVGAGLRGDV